MMFVCTGNVCRSPMAERLIIARRPSSRALVATSAGTAALAGLSIDPRSADAIRELGANPDGHVARQLTDDLLLEPDIVLAAETYHRAVILGRSPRLMRRTFTMAEFARLASTVDAADWVGRDANQRIEMVADRRGRVNPPAATEDDIADPYGQPLPVARVCAARIALVVDALVRVLLADPERC